MSKNETPVVDWMMKADLQSVLKIEEENFSFDAWGEQKFVSKLKEKNVIGMVCKVMDTVVGFMVYELGQKSFFLLNFAVAESFKNTKVAHTLLQELKRKAEKYKKNIKTMAWEGESVEYLKFFAKEGFKSRLKRDFFVENHPYSPDGVEFSWSISDF